MTTDYELRATALNYAMQTAPSVGTASAARVIEDAKEYMAFLTGMPDPAVYHVVTKGTKTTTTTKRGKAKRAVTTR